MEELKKKKNKLLGLFFFIGVVFIALSLVAVVILAKMVYGNVFIPNGYAISVAYVFVSIILLRVVGRKITKKIEKINKELRAQSGSDNLI